MNTVNSYYEYRVPIKGNIQRTDQYVSDIREVYVDAPNGQQVRARWIQYKIPVKSSDRKDYGGGGKRRADAGRCGHTGVRCTGGRGAVSVRQ